MASAQAPGAIRGKPLSAQAARATGVQMAAEATAAVEASASGSPLGFRRPFHRACMTAALRLSAIAIDSILNCAGWSGFEFRVSSLEFVSTETGLAMDETAGQSLNIEH